MEKLLNDQMLKVKNNHLSVQHSDVLVAEKIEATDRQGEIENGNLQDYLEIFGGDEDIL